MKIGDFGIGRVPITPVRAEHADPSEMVTQLLFGETIEVLDIYNQWIKIKILHDGYSGWVDSKQLLPISSKSAENLQLNLARQQNTILTLQTPWGKQHVLQGSPILSFESSFQIDDFSFHWIDELPKQEETSLNSLMESYLNTSYLWGGRTPFGLDCSGFTQTIFHQLGIYLNRDASQQALQGEEVDFNDRKEGDLAFFHSKTTKKIIHVGIVLTLGKIMHIHGRGRIDTLDEQGIFNEEEQYYSHQLNIIKRYKNN